MVIKAKNNEVNEVKNFGKRDLDGRNSGNKEDLVEEGREVSIGSAQGDFNAEKCPA